MKNSDNYGQEIRRVVQLGGSRPKDLRILNSSEAIIIARIKYLSEKSFEHLSSYLDTLESFQKKYPTADTSEVWDLRQSRQLLSNSKDTIPQIQLFIKGLKVEELIQFKLATMVGISGCASAIKTTLNPIYNVGDTAYLTTLELQEEDLKYLSFDKIKIINKTSGSELDKKVIKSGKTGIIYFIITEKGSYEIFGKALYEKYPNFAFGPPIYNSFEAK